MKRLKFILLLNLILLSLCKNPNVFTVNSSNFSITQTSGTSTLTIHAQEQTLKFTFRTDQLPVRTVAITSTTHLGFISALGEEQSVVAISGKKYVFNLKVRKRLDSIAELGFEPNLNWETLLKLKPQILLVSNYKNLPQDKVQLLQQAGIKVVPILEFVENSPLKRLQWIKVFGLFYKKLDKANKYYDSVAANYNALKQKVQNLDSARPKILVNIPYRGTWYIPGGRSYMARFIIDAGGNYPWANTEANFSIPMSFEQVFSKANDADILLNPSTATSIKQILQQEPRMKLFRAVQQKNVWNNNKLASPQGGSAFWETGTVQPDRILSDLIRIFYPKNTFTPDTLTYYQKLR